MYMYAAGAREKTFAEYIGECNSHAIDFTIKPICCCSQMLILVDFAIYRINYIHMSA